MEIPRNDLAVFAGDGRVFYDLDALIEGYEEHLSEVRLTAATLTDNERANGMAELLRTIREDLQMLRAENAADEQATA